MGSDTDRVHYWVGYWCICWVLYIVGSKPSLAIKIGIPIGVSGVAMDEDLEQKASNKAIKKLRQNRRYFTFFLIIVVLLF